MSKVQLKEACLEFAINLAVNEAGPEFREAFWRKGKYQSDLEIGAIKKLGNQFDSLTVADTLIENLIFSKLHRTFPDHLLIGEESSSNSDQRRVYNDKPTWIVDPIDGTNNFVHHFPQTGISIAMAIENSPEIGVIYLPALDELYFGSIGSGAYLVRNAAQVVGSMYSTLPKGSLCSIPYTSTGLVVELIKQSEKLPLYNQNVLGYIEGINSCSVFTEHGVDRHEPILSQRMNTLQRLLSSNPDPNEGGRIESLRFQGAACIDLINVAKGSADMYFESGPHIWDFAAAYVLVIESGGAVFSGDGLYGSPEAEKSVHEADYEPKPFNMWNRSVSAIRTMADRVSADGQVIAGSARKQQKVIVNHLLALVDLITYKPDGYPSSE